MSCGRHRIGFLDSLYETEFHEVAVGTLLVSGIDHSLAPAADPHLILPLSKLPYTQQLLTHQSSIALPTNHIPHVHPFSLSHRAPGTQVHPHFHFYIFPCQLTIPTLHTQYLLIRPPDYRIPHYLVFIHTLHLPDFTLFGDSLDSAFGGVDEVRRSNHGLEEVESGVRVRKRDFRETGGMGYVARGGVPGPAVVILPIGSQNGSGS